MPDKRRWAKIIRILSTPPLLATVMLILLVLRQPDFFNTWIGFYISIICLGLFPLLAYPTAHLFPVISHMGREGERKLAFVFCLIGYTLLMIYGICFRQAPQILLIYVTYFFSGWILALFNACFHVQTSGHACGTVGPILLTGYLLGWQWALPFIVLFLLAAWASVALKRHTLIEYLMGSMCCVGGFFIAWLLIHTI